MAQKILKIHTLGNFTVSVEGEMLTDSSTRASQLWKLFKYIITNRSAQIPTEKLIDILWSENECDDPLKALYSLVYRLRAVLNSAYDQKQEFIIFKHNSYIWNKDAPYELDADEFEQFCRKGESEKDQDQRFAYYNQAFEIYKGNYLSESSEIWSLSTVNYYKRLYAEIVSNLSKTCAANGDYKSVVRYCEAAINIDPYEEMLHYDLIDALIKLGQVSQAVAHYNYLAGVLYNELGVQPSERMAELYRSIHAASKESQYDIREIKENLAENKQLSAGVFFCDPETFKKIYQREVRSLERSDAVEALVSVSLVETDGEVPSGTQLGEGMTHLKRVVILGLRRGDVVTQYSDSQLLLLLPTASFSACETIAKRLSKQFNERCAHMGLRLKFGYSPVETDAD